MANPLFCAEESWFVCTNFLRIACINGKSVISCNIQTVVLCIPAENFPPWGGARQEANKPCRSTNPQKEPGREIAERIYSRHRLLTHFFMQLGVDEKTAAEDACKAEHILSEQTLEKIRERALETDAETGSAQ